MSRHKMIKNMDLDDEMDDVYGDEEEEYYEGGGSSQELSPEDQAQMRLNTPKVRAQLPANAKHVTDKQIEESLWHYYYDVGKSVDYLSKTFGVKEKKVVEKKDGSTDLLPLPTNEIPSGSSLRDFFFDMPWSSFPPAHQTIFIEPPYHGGLLGGSGDGAPKMSKLQALAAARKKKAQEQKSNGDAGMEKPMAELSINEKIAPVSKLEEVEHTKPTTRSFPLRKRKDSNPHEKIEKPPSVEEEESKMVVEEDHEIQNIPEPDPAEPSAFASTMFGRTNSPKKTKPPPVFSMPYNMASPNPPTDPFSGPSPDDVVLAAQSQAKAKGLSNGKTSSTVKTAKEKKDAQIAAGVEALKIDDTPKAKSKNLDVLKEFESAKRKNAANFVVIGHVDAGKSTLMGRLLYDLKVVDQRTIDRYRKEAEKMGKSSFALAWVLDQGSEERARGVTIDIATNKFETENTTFTILDAPGHRDFIPNMIAGASQADFAVLVIDAGTGNFESGLKGQTKEHALLVRSMGVQRIIVAVNKLDSVDWSEDRFTEIQQQVSAFLTTAGFQPKNIAFVPCSGLNGDNITRKSTESAASWYKGLTLVEELENSEPVARALTKPLRLTISDIFRGGIQNPLSISGRIEAGSLQTGDALLIQPSSQKAFIKSLEVDDSQSDWAVAGQNVILHLQGVEEQYLKVGDVICSPSSPIQNIKSFEGKFLAFEFMTPMAVEVHRGRLAMGGVVKSVVGEIDKGTGKLVGGGKKKVRVVKPGMLVRLQIELESNVPLEAGARVVLRSAGETVAAGLLE